MIVCILGLTTAEPPQVTGDVLYNGYPFTDFVVQRTAAYVDQQDNHLAQVCMTSKQKAEYMGLGKSRSI